MTRPKFNPVHKDRLFYDRYTYCMGFYLEEASCLRDLDHGRIDNNIERRRQWREMAQQRWVNGVQPHGLYPRRLWKSITEKTVEDLHAVAKVLLTNKTEYKLVVTVHQCHVYTNDLALIDQLTSMPILTYATYTQALVDRPKNTLTLRNPKHKFRTYLRMLTLNTEQKDNLMVFLHNQQHIRMSPALDRWFDTPFNRSQDYFFVDHDTESWLTMLGLVHPGLVRKTIHIIPAK